MGPSGIVYIAEDSEMQDAFRLSGLFSAHCEDDDSEAGTDGPQGVPLEDAIAWGRGRADIVLVRIGEGETFYSAGPIDPDFPTQRYPTEGITVKPRPSGTPPDGRQQNIRWRIESRILASRDGVPREQDLRHALERNSRASDVKVTSAPDGSLVVRLTVQGRGGDDAVRKADEAVRRSLEGFTAGRSSEDLPRLLQTGVVAPQ